MNFDLTGVKTASGDFEPIPVGVYPAFVERLEWRKSKSGAEYLNVMFKIFGEKHANRVIFMMLNLLNPNEKARSIALSDLKKMLLASGWEEDKLNFASKEDVAQAVKTVRCLIKVNIKKDEEYGDRNVIKGFEQLDEKQLSPTLDPSDIPF